MAFYDEISYSVTPYVARVNKAIEFFNRNLPNNTDTGLMLCIAEGPTEGWPIFEGNEVPPLPTLTLSQLENVIGFKRYKSMRFVTSDDAGIYSVGGLLWKPVSGSTVEENIYYARQVNSRWLYIETELDVDDLDVGDVYYRQIGLYSNLKIRTDVENYTTRKAFFPNEIVTTINQYNYDGILEVYQNVNPKRRPIDFKETFSWVLEF